MSNRPPKKKRPPLPVKSLREAAGLTQQQLADELGVTNMTVSRWEREETTPLPAFERQIKKMLAAFPGYKETP